MITKFARFKALRETANGEARLVIVGPLAPPVTGASRITAEVYRNAMREGLSADIVNTSATNPGYHVRRCARYLRACWLLARRRLSGPVVVYQTGAGGLGVWYQALITMLARFLRCRSVFHHHSYAYLTKTSRAMRVIARFSGNRSVHIVLCDDMARLLFKNYGIDQIEVVSNATFLGPSQRFDAKSKPSEWIIGHLGNLGPEKGLPIVLESARLLRERGFSIKLRIAGPVADSATELMLASHLEDAAGLDDWLGPLEPAEVGGFLSTLDCFVFPSTYRNESSPLVVLEALQRGVPTVTTDVGCLGSLLSGSGWVAPPHAPAVADAVVKVLQSPSARSTAQLLYASTYEKDRTTEFFRRVMGSE